MTKLLFLLCALLDGCGEAYAQSFLYAPASNISNSQLATETANTVIGNKTGSSATPSYVAMPSCTDTAGNHLNYTNGTGFSCGTSSNGSTPTPTTGTGSWVLGTSPTMSGVTLNGTTTTSVVTVSDTLRQINTSGAPTAQFWSDSTGFATSGIEIANNSSEVNMLRIIQYNSSTSGATFGLNKANSFNIITSGSNNTGLAIGTTTNVPTIFGTNGSEAYRVDGGQKLLVGYTSNQDSSEVQVNGRMLAKRGVVFVASNPTASPCGTSPIVRSNSSNYSGSVTVGSVSATSCVITFATAFATYNNCIVTSQSSITGLAYSYTASAITVTGPSLIGDVLDYKCDGI